MSESIDFPRSPKDEIDGLPYFLRMCHKIRMHQAGELHADYQSNLGKGFDLWICQLLGIEYADLASYIIEQGAGDREALDWAYAHGTELGPAVKQWWCSYARNRGYKDDLSEVLVKRKQDAGLEAREDIQCFFDFIDAEESR